MTALAADKPRTIKQFKTLDFTLTSGTKAFKGGMAAIRLPTGKVVPATAAATDLVIGVFAQNVDATSADKAVQVDLEREITAEWVANSASTDAVAAADVGRTVYVADDATVTITPAGAVAGRCWAVSSTQGVLVEKLDVSTAPQVGATLAFSSADIVVTAAQCVNGAVFDVPTSAANSTITLPTTGVRVGTEVIFNADGTKNGHTVQYRFGTTAITTALTASKVHQVRAIRHGAGWTAIAYVSP
jgi:hypothetical protein